MAAGRGARAGLRASSPRPRRRWGQHFLHDPHIAARIVEAAEIDDEVVLEIGPGRGALTDALARRAAALRLVEIDPRLAEQLRARHAEQANVRLIVGDVLALDLESLWDLDTPGIVVSNLPYNVSTPVLFRLLEWRRTFPRAVLMLQREVVERLVAPPGTRARGVLSALVQAHASVRRLFGVRPGAFRPAPRVDSAVVEVRWRARPVAGIEDWERYRAVVRAAFGQRRKMLRNALADLETVPALEGPAVVRLLEAAAVDPRARAEMLDVDAFARIARALESV